MAPSATSIFVVNVSAITIILWQLHFPCCVWYIYWIGKRCSQFLWRYSLFSSWSRLRQHDEGFSSWSQWNTLPYSVLYCMFKRIAWSQLNIYIRLSTRATSGTCLAWWFQIPAIDSTGTGIFAGMKTTCVMLKRHIGTRYGHEWRRERHAICKV